MEKVGLYFEITFHDFPEYYTSNALHELHEPHLICFTKFLVVFLYFVVVSGLWVDFQNFISCI